MSARQPGATDFGRVDRHPLLDPPDLDEVRAALRAVDADALVYLLPSDPTGGGAAVLVPRDEAPYHVALPRLTAEPSQDMHRSGGPVVGDPAGDLLDARDDAVAIRATYYPEATLLGPEPPPRAAVLDWLRPARSLLHLACHGGLDAGGSYLTLADGAQLTARQLVEARDRTTIGLVVLAACTTGVPAGSYNEAFSIPTAFLAAGAATVFGSLWPVPSDTTSLLMFMAHHYLRGAGLRPADALHRAQLWMLDPDRVAPAEMPAVVSQP